MNVENNMSFNFDSSVTMKTILVTPEIAKYWLGKSNFSNRSIRKSHVDSLAGCIKRGEWRVSPQGIVFHTEGRLLDGQHRLKAVVQANIPVYMVVFKVQDEGIFQVLDQGAKRNISDISGVDRRVVEVANFSCRLMLNKFTSLSYGQVEPVLNSVVGETSHELVDFCGIARKGFSASPFKTACVLSVVFGNDKDYAFTLYKNLLESNFRSLPPIGEAFLRQLSTGSIDFGKTNGGKNTFARSMKLFDISNKNNTVIRIPASTMSQHISGYAKDLKSLLIKNGSIRSNWASG